MSDWRAVHCWCLLSIALAGCDAPPQEYANVLVRDSAGVSIVENRAPVSEDWTVDPDPLLQLGVVEGDSAYAFTAVRQAVRLEDGRLLVVDRGCYCVRVFSADGKAIGRIGRFGEGPGEFSTDPLIRSAGGGGIVAWDDRQLRLSWFSADGTLQKDSMLINVVRNARVTQISGGTTWRITSSGDLFSVSGNLVLDEQTRWITASRPVLLPLGGGTIPFGEYKHAAQLFVRRADGASIGVASPFVVSPIVELLPAHDQVVVSNTSDWQLSFRLRDGVVNRVVRAAVPRAPITSDLIRATRDRMASTTGLSEREIDAAYAQLGIPDSIPAIGSIMLAPPDRIMVGRRTADGPVHTFDVISTDGRWLATVRVPQGAGRVLTWGADYLITTPTDEWDVSYVRVYRLHGLTD